MAFDEPAWLLLAALSIPLGLLGIRCFRAMSASRRWLAILARLALIALIAALLAGASMRRTVDRLAVVAIVDVSGSVQRYFNPPSGHDGKPRTLGRAVNAFLEPGLVGRKPDDLIGVITVGARASALFAPQPVAQLPEIPPDPTAREGTDLAAAIRLAAAMIPAGAAGRIVLFSDGVETTGTALAAAREISAGAPSSTRHHIPVDVVPLEYAVTDEVYVESADSPPTAPAGSQITVRVVLNASSSASGTLSLLHEGELLDINGPAQGRSRRLALRAGRTVELIPVELPPGRVHRFEAVWEPDRSDVNGAGDTVLTNNRAQAFTVSPGSGEVLIVDGVSTPDASGGGGDGNPAAVLGRTLAAAGMQVRTVLPDAIPPDLLALQAFDLVILQNVPADAVPLASQAALATYITDLGGGLIMVGGPDSFGAGGWKASALEPLLPVQLDLPQQLIVASTAVVIVIDNSGSMNRSVTGSDRSQQEIANAGAALAIETLDKTDLVGVISFNSSHTVEIPLGPNSDPRAASARVRTIAADGGTNLPPALAAAHDQLRRARAEIKHIIVLSDGVSQNKGQLPSMVRSLEQDGIRLSTIAVGDDADTDVMATMAEIGRGKFYRATDPGLLPRIFIKAVRTVRSPLVREQPFTPTVLPTGSPVLDGLVGSGGGGAGELPPLNGLTLTVARTEPTIVTPIVSNRSEPVLAHWSIGLGRVAAFTSDAHRWAAPWLPWDGYGRFWTQLARYTSRSPASRSHVLLTSLEGDDLRVRFEAADDSGRPMDLLDVPVTIHTPERDKHELRLSQVGPGVYEARVPAPASGTYIVTAAPREGAKPLTPSIAGVARPSGVEYRRLRSDATLLQRIAETTGGRVLTLASRGNEAESGGAPVLFDRAGLRPAIARTPLREMLLIWLVAVMLLDVAMRRVAWDRFFSREFGASMAQETVDALRDRTEQVRQTVGRLRRRETEVDQAVAAASTGRSLGDQDAVEIAIAQRRRRAEARKAEFDRPPHTPPPAATPVTPPSQDQPADPATGLFAAKRRARDRLQRDEQ